MTKFGKQAGINVGILSSFLNSQRVLSPDQLDKITTAMNLKEGSLYNQYIEESLMDSSPDWRRIKNFLYRCAELNKIEHIKKVTDMLSNDLLYSSFLFEAAEEFFKTKKMEAAIILYENVAINERKQHSERLAVCQYRLFMAKQSYDQEENYRLAITFEPFIERLNEVDELEALKDLSNIYRSLRRWDKVEKVAEQLQHKAWFQYHLEHKNYHQNWHLPLFVYILHAYLLLGGVNEERKDYKKALEYAEKSGDSSWVQENDEKAESWKQKFKEWSIVNSHVAKLFSGDKNIIEAYTTYALSRSEEVPLFLLNITEAANRFSFDIDHILQQFNTEIQNLANQIQSMDRYTEQMNRERYIRFLYEMANYELRKTNYELGFNQLLDALKQSHMIDNKIYIIRCVDLFEKYNNYADIKIKRNYKSILKEIQQDSLLDWLN